MNEHMVEIKKGYKFRRERVNFFCSGVEQVMFWLRMLFTFVEVERGDQMCTAVQDVTIIL